jgi:SH3-like domain-containing protein
MARGRNDRAKPPRRIARARVRAIVAAFTATLVLAAPAGAAAQAESGLKVPRFVSLDAERVNLRTGPGVRYPIEWVLTRKGMPVEVIAQFEHWRRIREWDGTVGWVQQQLVSGRRHVIVEKGGARSLHRQPDPTSPVVAWVEPGVVARLIACHDAWCRISADRHTGWMRRADLWGVYPDETVR